MVTIRDEVENDIDTVREVNASAFPTPVESQLVDALRAAGKAVISLVAVAENGKIVGHILFSHATVENGDKQGLGLAPVAVVPLHQSQGIGSQLIGPGWKEPTRLTMTLLWCWARQTITIALGSRRPALIT